MIILATVLVFPGHSQAQTSELPASLQDARELRELVQQLPARVAQLEAQHTKGAQGATLQQVSAGNESARQASPPERTADEEQAPAEASAAQASNPAWQYGGFLDFGYLKDFNDPANHLFRSRGTTFHVNEWDVDMAAIYLRKTASENSRWGTELTLQAGKDTQVFGFSATAPNLPGSKWLRHLGPVNFSYLAPVGKGLTLQGGIFSSFIGYDSLYAKDNFTYTRPWGADFTPYFMLGVNAGYPFTSKLTGTLFVVNGYWHLADANSVPSSGGQLAYNPTDHVTLKQTFLYGPHQSNTSLEFWRFLSDSIVERKGDRITSAFEYIVGTEKVAAPANPRALWMAAQLPVRWAVSRRFSATVRPEVYWDRDGRTTGFSQTVKANTTSLEYRIPYRQASAILRLEHRIDDSRGPGGGFFNDREAQPGVVGLTPTQNLLIFGVILTFDSSFHH
ncbi:MAG: outer membrane beta-barrel protein [Terriglobales bacterium]